MPSYDQRLEERRERRAPACFSGPGESQTRSLKQQPHPLTCARPSTAMLFAAESDRSAEISGRDFRRHAALRWALWRAKRLRSIGLIAIVALMASGCPSSYHEAFRLGDKAHVVKAEYDLYFVEGEGSFSFNYFKGAAGRCIAA